MPIFRSLFLSSKQCPLNLLQRFGQSKGFQARSYAKSTRRVNQKPDGHPVMSVETQSPRSRSTYIIPAAAVLGFAGLATFVHYNDERRVVLKGQGNSGNDTTVNGPIIGGPFTLVDTENKTVTEKNLLGNWVLLYFGYTSSPDVGPDQVQMMAKAIKLLESKHNVKVLPVFVTIDPQRDTPSQLRAYLQEFDSKIMGLTGPVTAIRHMAQEYRVFFRKIEEERNDYLVESSHNMYLINPNMEVARCFGVEYDAEDLSEAIVKELKKTPRIEMAGNGMVSSQTDVLSGSL